MNNNISKGCNHDFDSGGFWKKLTNPVPGRPHKEVRNVSANANSRTSFQEFQKNVNDAWDLGEDEFLNSSKENIPVQETHSLQEINWIGNKQLCNFQPIKSNERLTHNKEITDKISSKKNLHIKILPTKYYKVQPRIHSMKPSIFTLIFTKSATESDAVKMAKFKALLDSPSLNINDLQKLSWSGVPSKLRPITWRLLAGYLPIGLERREEALERKRLDYWILVKQYYNSREKDEVFKETYRQIHIDIPRMSPMLPLFQEVIVQEMFERILFIWAIRHPASGYVQGINDLVTPFFVVFLLEELTFDELETLQITSMPKLKLQCIEADSFWCFSRFISDVQDNYVFAQLGIQQKIKQLNELVQRIDNTLHKHIENHGISYLQFSFRWMNNLLTRELPLWCTIRLWDTYLAEASFASLHIYVCAAFLMQWSQQLLKENDFQGLMLMLQNLPTQNWTAKEINVLVAEAYKLKYTFADAPNHLQNHFPI